MANGGDAIDAGMDVVFGTEDRRQGYDEDNKSRDYVAGGPNYWLPGLVIDPTKKAAARTALGVLEAGATVKTNGAYVIDLIWDGVNLQLFIAGVFVGYVSLNHAGVGSWGND